MRFCASRIVAVALCLDREPLLTLVVEVAEVWVVGDRDREFVTFCKDSAEAVALVGDWFLEEHSGFAFLRSLSYTKEKCGIFSSTFESLGVVSTVSKDDLSVFISSGNDVILLMPHVEHVQLRDFVAKIFRSASV